MNSLILRIDQQLPHTSIADFYGFKGKKEDKLNKYEYNPLTRDFKIDQMNTVDDKCLIEEFCRELDFKTIVEPLIVKKIIHPFKDKHTTKVTKKDIALLKGWASVWASVRDFVWDSVWASVGGSVRDSVWASVGGSVRDSARASVWASVWAYVSSFFNIKYKFDFSPCIKLWERGLVPSFDGTDWRLHGKEGKEVFKISAESLHGGK